MNQLVEIIRREIAPAGAIPFARFMALALYCPQLGYYERNQGTVGRRGDFYTSVSPGPLFGEMLAFQFAEWLTEMRSVDCGVRIIEAGAHDGKLAADILRRLRERRPALFERLEYVILEPSPVRREWQQNMLHEFEASVKWFADLENWRLATGNCKSPAILFSNELLDAFPVRRFGWDAREKKWFEWGVALAGDNFVWTKISNPQTAICNPQLESVLPDGYTIEICPAAEAWWTQAANSLAAGKLVTIDYGFAAEELFAPERRAGTLRAYHRHHVSDDLLANAGEQDLTAHVNFAALQSAGEATGLKTESFVTQPQFLTRILEKTLRDSSFGEWTPARTRQFQTLTHPQHLGRAFRVLVQARDPAV